MTAVHPPVRALSRGLALLSELNFGGPTSVLDLAKRTGVNRTTAYRLLSTLRDEGLVTVDEPTGFVSPTPLVRRLSDGLTARDAMSQAAMPAMFALMQDVQWPSDLGVYDAGSVVIRESTHPFSVLSIHRGMIGVRRPFLRSALGRAILAAAKPALRQEMVGVTATSSHDDAGLARDASYVERIVAQVRRDGYAWSVGETETNISAIAQPIRSGGHILGSLNVIFFSSTMTPEVAARRFLDKLDKAVDAIETQFKAASRHTKNIASPGM